MSLFIDKWRKLAFVTIRSHTSLIIQARDLDAALTRNGISHEFEEFMGSHMDKLGEGFHSDSAALPDALINLAIKDAIAREESSCRKCFPETAS
jgi:hypothetical protein